MCVYWGQELCDWDCSAPLSPLILVQFEKCWLGETPLGWLCGRGELFMPFLSHFQTELLLLSRFVELSRAHCAVLLFLLDVLSAGLRANSWPRPLSYLWCGFNSFLMTVRSCMQPHTCVALPKSYKRNMICGGMCLKPESKNDTSGAHVCCST